MSALPPAAYAASLWTSFFSAEVSASAALTGLLFVAVSVNITRILQLPQLGSLTAKALTTLVEVLLVGTLCLVPGQSARTLGIELLILGGAAWYASDRVLRAATRNNIYISRWQKIFKSALTHAGSLPVFISGISLVLGRGGGLYCLIGAVLFSYLSALQDAWVLLIEILR